MAGPFVLCYPQGMSIAPTEDYIATENLFLEWQRRGMTEFQVPAKGGGFEKAKVENWINDLRSGATPPLPTAKVKEYLEFMERIGPNVKIAGFV